MTETRSAERLNTHGSAAPNPQLRSRELGRIGDPSKGTTLVVIGGVHGNERAGLYAGRRVLDALSDSPRPMHGQFIVLAGNLAALNHTDPHTRYVDSDLNRLCKDNHFEESPSTSVEHAQMHELFSALQEIHASSQRSGQRLVVLDLHTTSAPSRPVVVFEDSLAAREHAMRIPCPKYLGIEEEAEGLLIDAVTRRLGCVSYLIEGGQHEDPNAIDVHESAIWIALDTAGIVGLDESGGDPVALIERASKNQGHVVYDVRHREPIVDEDFAIADGIESGIPVHPRRTIIATQRGQPVYSPIYGRVFLPNMQTHKRIGDDGFFIVRRVSSGWVNLSASLRRRDWVHTLIAMMPGVYRSREDHRSTLLIDADLACVLRRQVFHLFGYRLVRHDDRKGGTGLRRVINGIAAFLRALLRGPSRGMLDAEDRRFWIVQRHTLDR